MPTLANCPFARALGRVALIAGLSCAAALPASAAVFTAHSLNVYRDGTPADWTLGNNRLLSDSFDNNNPFVGSNFLTTGQAATYTLQGLANAADVGLAVRESGGLLTMDSAYGAVATNALGQSGPSLRLRLQTNVTDPAAGLTRGKSFAATLRLSLSAMPDVGQTFGFRLNDANIGSNNNDVIELFVSGGAAGDTVVFRKQDFTNGAITVLGSAPLVAPGGADMLVLSLTHATADSDLIFGGFGFADAGGSLLGGLSSFASSALGFQGETHTRLELRASGLAAPVPEPGGLALMTAGLGFGLWRRKRLRR